MFTPMIMLLSGMVSNVNPPKYYDKIFDGWNPEEMHNIKTRRKFLALQSDEHERSWERMEVKEAIQYLKAQKLVRPLEGDM